LSSGFSRRFLLVWRGRERTLIAEAVGLVFRSCLGDNAYRYDKRSYRLLMVCHRVRSQSFFSWRLHPNASLRASTCSPASAQAADFDRLAPEYSLRPSCEAKLVPIRPASLGNRTSKGSTPHHGLSKVRRDRDRRHDRCNHLPPFLSQRIETACASLAVSADSIVREGRHGRTRRGWLAAAPSSPMLPGLPLIARALISSGSAI